MTPTYLTELSLRQVLLHFVVLLGRCDSGSGPAYFVTVRELTGLLVLLEQGYAASILIQFIRRLQRPDTESFLSPRGQHSIIWAKR